MTNTVEYLKETFGVEVELCDYFKGNDDYVNIIFKDRLTESKDYDLLVAGLKKFNKEYSKVEPNGVRRAALFITK